MEKIDKNSPVLIYRNLHRGLLSVKQKTVKGYCDRIVLDGVSFKVSEAGRQKTLREKRKNVHAYVRGFISDERYEKYILDIRFKRIFYDPYRFGYFFDETLTPIFEAQKAILICLDEPKTVLMLAMP